MKKIITIILSTLMIVGFAAAQTKTTKVSTSTPTIKAGTVLVATVDIYNATSTVINKNNYSVSFQIYNHTGIQSDIRYGLELVDASTSAIIDTQLANQSLTLGEDAYKDIQMNYSIPAYIVSGNYKLVIVAENQNGLPLAYMPAGFPERIIKIANNYIAPTIDNCSLSVAGTSTKSTATQGIVVLPTDTLTATCNIINKGNSNLTNLKIKLITHKKDQFGDIVSTNVIDQDLSINASASKSVSFNIPVSSTPQSYNVDTFLINSSQAKISPSIGIRYAVRGTSATIQNAILDKTNYKKGDSANLKIFWTPSVVRSNTKESYTLKASISDSTGASCGTGSKTASSSSALSVDTLKILVTKDCTNAVASVSILDKNGTVLDSVNININNPTSEINVNPNIASATTANGINKIYMFIFLIVLVLVGYGILVLRKDHKNI